MRKEAQIEFDEIASQIWAQMRTLLASDLQTHLDRIHLLIFDVPPPELLSDLEDDLAEHPEELMGLHVGTPLTEISLTHPDYEPVRVYLFRKAILDEIDSDRTDFKQALTEEIAITLMHEVGHSFGLEEEDLERLGYG